MSANFNETGDLDECEQIIVSDGSNDEIITSIKGFDPFDLAVNSKTNQFRSLTMVFLSGLISGTSNFSLYHFALVLFFRIEVIVL